ncbi:hypothetical protein [Vibrio parahaemolyticus]|uniref:hypothetical protein n=1 Tax=Vibrio parahaemolyticus TaxID=670 RepID=UPI001110E564|nr:hypothetical protein [Vibrio parahaemolyticus]TMX39253.1 hypothetical protein DA098_10765 [Vibrio parahaemolyticus]TMX78737.1 hypothetical protein DA094_09595 [Vibrio parahaemolyticus]HCE1512221.1 hypothetical protein [Vibrio parahaemolyticus]HCG6646129.1 hypothetical protein [Vibrio parahaemolyticus]
MSRKFEFFVKELKLRVLNHEDGFEVDFRRLRCLELGITNNYHAVSLLVEEAWKLAEEQFGELITYNLSYEIEKLETQNVKDYIESMFNQHELLDK